MASFSNLSVEDRYSLAHYVRTFSPNPPADTPEDLKAAGLMGGPGSVPQVKEVPPIPIEMAMDKIEEPDEVLMPSDKPEMNAGTPGAKIYEQKCMACHGMNGMGAQVQLNQGQFPAVSPMTKSWMGIHADWAGALGSFVDIVSKHIPGGSEPGVADLTKEEWAQLFNYSKELVGHKE
jgi:mono/diheme cytochrome c family protein